MPKKDILPLSCTPAARLPGTVLFGYLFGALASLWANQDARRSAYAIHAARVKAHLQEETAPAALQDRALAYLDYLWRFRNGHESQAYLDSLPLSLQTEVVFAILNSLLLRIPSLAGAPTALLRALALRCKPGLLLPGERRSSAKPHHPLG